MAKKTDYKPFQHYCFVCKEVTTHTLCENCSGYVCHKHNPWEEDYNEYKDATYRYPVHVCRGER